MALHLAALPVPLLQHIISYTVTPLNLNVLVDVSKAWQELLDSSAIWKDQVLELGYWRWNLNPQWSRMSSHWHSCKTAIVGYPYNRVLGLIPMEKVLDMWTVSDVVPRRTREGWESVFVSDRPVPHVAHVEILKSFHTNFSFGLTTMSKRIMQTTMLSGGHRVASSFLPRHHLFYHVRVEMTAGILESITIGYNRGKKRTKKLREPLFLNTISFYISFRRTENTLTVSVGPVSMDFDLPDLPVLPPSLHFYFFSRSILWSPRHLRTIQAHASRGTDGHRVPLDDVLRLASLPIVCTLCDDLEKCKCEAFCPDCRAPYCGCHGEYCSMCKWRGCELCWTDHMLLHQARRKKARIGAIMRA